MTLSGRSIGHSRNRFVLKIVLLTLMAASLLIAGKEKASQGNPYPDAYTMETVALKGPDATDVYATFSTADPAGFPLPDALKKLQVKIKDADDEVVFISNSKLVPLVSGVATVSVAEPAPHLTLFVQAHIKTTTREVVLSSTAPVLFRPDLIVQDIIGPEETHVDEPFNLEAVIQELNLDVGATATVNLFDNGDLLASIPGVSVAAGQSVAVIFAGLTLSDTGTHTLKVTISDTDPGEYDTSNNSASITIEVTEARNFQISSYYFYYSNYLYTVDQVVNHTCNPSYVYNFEHYHDYSYLRGISSGDLPVAPLENVSWEYSSDTGINWAGEVENLQPYLTNYYADYYQHFDPATGVYVWIYVYKYYGYTQYYLYHYSYRYYYIYNYSDGTVYEYDYPYDNEFPFLDAHSSITATILIDDDVVTLGGTTTLNLSGYIDSDSSSYEYNQGSCPYDYTVSYTSHNFSGSISGILDPSVLFKGVVTDAATPTLPDRIQLHENYPNPFNPSTLLRVDLPEDTPIRLVIYDLAGREIAILAEGVHTAGSHALNWSGQTRSRQWASSGIYIARLITPEYTKSIKLVLLR